MTTGLCLDLGKFSSSVPLGKLKMSMFNEVAEVIDVAIDLLNQNLLSIYIF